MVSTWLFLLEESQACGLKGTCFVLPGSQARATGLSLITIQRFSNSCTPRTPKQQVQDRNGCEGPCPREPWPASPGTSGEARRGSRVGIGRNSEGPAAKGAGYGQHTSRPRLGTTHHCLPGPGSAAEAGQGAPSPQGQAALLPAQPRWGMGPQAGSLLSVPDLHLLQSGEQRGPSSCPG